LDRLGFQVYLRNSPKSPEGDFVSGNYYLSLVS
jgi:hypothetical protein